jgi:hypothetical protein
MYILFPEAALVRAFQLPDWTVVAEWATPGGTGAVLAGVLWDGLDVVPTGTSGSFNLLLAMRVSVPLPPGGAVVSLWCQWLVGSHPCNPSFMPVV